MTQTTEQLMYSVPGVSCGHCRVPVISRVEKFAGVWSVVVDLDAKPVTVAGAEVDDDAAAAALDKDTP